MSRRARHRAAAIAAKHVALVPLDDDTDDEGGIDAHCLACDGTGLEWDGTTCAACGGRCTLEATVHDD